MIDEENNDGDGNDDGHLEEYDYADDHLDDDLHHFDDDDDHHDGNGDLDDDDQSLQAWISCL